MREWARSMWRRPAARAVATVSSGTAVAQLALVVSAPVLARLYEPESFGVFSYVVAATAVIAAVSSFKFEWTIPLAAELDEARALLRLSLYLALATSAAAGLAILVGGRTLDERSELELLPYLWWLPPLVFLTSAFTVLSQTAIRQRAYQVVAYRSALQAIATVISQMTLSAATKSPVGLLGGQTFGRCVGIITLARSGADLLTRPQRGSYLKVARRYWRYPAIFTPSALCNVVGTQLPLLIVGGLYGSEAVGQFGMAQRIALLPASLLGVAVGEVFRGELSARMRAGTLMNRSMYLRTSAALGVAGSVLALLLLSIGPVLFPLVLGDQWQGAGLYARAMAVSIGLGLMVSPVSQVFVAYGRSLSGLAVDVSRILSIGGAAIVAIRLGADALAVVWAMYAAQAVNYALTWLVGLQIAGGEQRGAVARVLG